MQSNGNSRFSSLLKQNELLYTNEHVSGVKHRQTHKYKERNLRFQLKSRQKHRKTVF